MRDRKHGNFVRLILMLARRPPHQDALLPGHPACHGERLAVGQLPELVNPVPQDGGRDLVAANALHLVGGQRLRRLCADQESGTQTASQESREP